MVDWSEYLAEFHAERAGVSETVLRRTISGHHNPYHWLARAISSHTTTILDIACGSGAMERELVRPGRTVVGLDLSEEELQRAARSGPGPWVIGDGRRLPFADESFDAVVTTLGLASIHPTEDLLDEVSRVLRPGGVFVGMAPTVRPMNLQDMQVAGQLTRLLRTSPRFPTQIELTVGQLLQAHGLRKVEDARERYRFAVRTREDADLLLSSFYLPHTTDERLTAAADWMVVQAERHGQLQVPIPLRRIAAIK